MSKQEFLAKLKSGLTQIPQDDLEERINFYSEMIDDRMEEGLTEEQAVAELGTIESIVMQIVSEIPLTKLVKEKVKPDRKLRAWEIVLLVLGSPIWLSLFIALFAIVLSIYIVIWSLIVSLWAVEVSAAVCFVGGLAAFVVCIAKGSIPSGIAMSGMALICAGLMIFGYFGCKYITKAILIFTKKILIWVKSRFMNKEAAK